MWSKGQVSLLFTWISSWLSTIFWKYDPFLLLYSATFVINHVTIYACFFFFFWALYPSIDRSCHLRLQSGVYGGYHFVSGVFCSANWDSSMSLPVSIVHFFIAKSEPILWIFYHFSSIHLLVDIYQPNFGATLCCNSLPLFPLISFYSENREGDISPELIFFYEFLR